MAVRVQVGKMPLSVVGWISDTTGLPYLLREVAEATEATIKEWEDATPSAH
jgi:hypothetical protein